MIPMNTLCRLQMVSFLKNMKYVVLAMKIVSLIRDKSLRAILLELKEIHSQITKIVTMLCFLYTFSFSQLNEICETSKKIHI